MIEHAERELILNEVHDSWSQAQQFFLTWEPKANERVVRVNIRTIFLK